MIIHMKSTKPIKFPPGHKFHLKQAPVIKFIFHEFCFDLEYFLFSNEITLPLKFYNFVIL